MSRKRAKAAPRARSRSNSRKPRRSAQRRGVAKQERLSKRLRDILAPDHTIHAEEIASILIRTTEELRAHRGAVASDPRALKLLKDAQRKLSAFRNHWKGHPALERHVPRNDAHPERIAAITAKLDKRLDAAIASVQAGSASGGSSESARRWLGMAVVTALRARGIEVSRHDKGIAVRTLAAACDLMELPKLNAEALRDYIDSGARWSAKLRY